MLCEVGGLDQLGAEGALHGVAVLEDLLDVPEPVVLLLEDPVPLLYLLEDHAHVLVGLEEFLVGVLIVAGD